MVNSRVIAFHTLVAVLADVVVTLEDQLLAWTLLDVVVNVLAVQENCGYLHDVSVTMCQSFLVELEWNDVVTYQHQADSPTGIDNA